VGNPLGTRLRAWLALAAFAGSFGLPFADPHRFGASDDAACSPVAFVSGHAVIGVGPLTPSTPPEHCPFCHFGRALCGAAPTPVVALVRPVDAAVATSAAVRSLRDSAVVERPSRAPPLALL
jgi:hypothetical protein